MSEISQVSRSSPPMSPPQAVYSPRVKAFFLEHIPTQFKQKPGRVLVFFFSPNHKLKTIVLKHQKPLQEH